MTDSSSPPHSDAPPEQSSTAGSAPTGSADARGRGSNAGSGALPETGGERPKRRRRRDREKRKTVRSAALPPVSEAKRRQKAAGGGAEKKTKPDTGPGSTGGGRRQGPAISGPDSPATTAREIPASSGAGSDHVAEELSSERNILEDVSLPSAWRSPCPPSDDPSPTAPPVELDRAVIGQGGGERGGEATEAGRGSDQEVGSGLSRIGDYTLDRCLGAGGMAVIYKSVQRSLGRTVALKVLRPEVAREGHFVKRFQREASTLASLQHENIIQVYSYHTGSRFQYFVMEYVEGIDLFDLMEKCGPLPVDVAAVIALQAARALEHAHYRGIIHRDVKPANIMISYTGAIKLMDFGIARVPDTEELTQHGTGLGTPSYMSPEQVVGDHLDGRTDIFSLATVTHQMLTGEKPFVADTKQTVLHKIRLHKPQSPRKKRPDLPRGLERIIGRCHQKRKTDRYWPTRELVRALERFLANRGVESENALLVSFFREEGFIDSKLADEHLEMARQSGYESPAGHHRFPIAKSAAMFGGAVLTLLLLLAGGLIGSYLFPTNDEKSRDEKAATSQAATSQAAASEEGRTEKTGGGRTASIRVTVQPWAHVYIDGKKVATTPHAEPIPVRPGRMIVDLKNPYCKTKSIGVGAWPGKPASINETLSCESDSDPPGKVTEGRSPKKKRSGR